MPGVTFKVFNNGYSLDVGKSDWIGARTEGTGANNQWGHTQES